MSAATVRLRVPELRYVERAPFDPPNPVYAAVEQVLAALGLDAARAGHPSWNPLGDLVARGGSVVIKPNLVASKDRQVRIEGDLLWASSTHGSLLRPIVDYALRAVGPTGRVRVVDAPVEGCAIERVGGPLGIFDVVEHHRRRGAPLDFVDLRTFQVRPRMALDDLRVRGRSLNAGALVRERLPGDDRGYRVVDLGDVSAFARAGAPPGRRLRFHRSHYETPVPHHTGGRHQYSIPGSVLAADLVVSLPKLKTHKKTGVTLGLKNVIGLTDQKYWLPHFTAGHPGDGGDEFDRPQSMGERISDKLSRLPLPAGHSLILRAPQVRARPRVIDGGWEGNRTLWRTVLDLHAAVLRCDREGVLQERPQRNLLTLVDGIVAGEGEGPLGATPVDAGLLVAGLDAAQVDAASVRAMGFDPARIPLVVEALRESGAEEVPAIAIGPMFARAFVPPRSWPSLLAVR